MLLMVDKGIRGRLCYSINRCVNDRNKYMKDYDKNKEPSHLKYWGVNNLYDCTISQNLPVNDFKWLEDIFKFNESFIKSYNGETFTMIYHFYLNLHDKTEYAIHIKNLGQALNQISCEKSSLESLNLVKKRG